MRTVYFDIENTLDVPFITGIQRVTREFSKCVLVPKTHKLTHSYIPVTYDYRSSRWRKLNSSESKALISNKPRSLNLWHRIIGKIRTFLPKSKSLYLEQFEVGSIFLDIDSSWHSRQSRERLLPVLKQSGVRLAKLHYDIIPLLFSDTTHPNTVKVFNSHFEAHLQQGSLFICISRKTQQDVVSHCAQNQLRCPELATIELGSTLSSVEKPHTKKLPKFSCRPPVDGQYLLMVGTIEPRKNHVTLLNAFAKIADQTDLKLVIVGKVGWLADGILAAIRSSSMYGDRIHYFDKITDTELSRLYKNAWLTVVPSLYEGFGLPVVEALHQACPTICSNTGSLLEVGAKNVRFFSPDSVSQLAELILQLYRDKNAYATLCEAASSFKPVEWSETTRAIDRSLKLIE